MEIVSTETILPFTKQHEALRESPGALSSIISVITRLTGAEKIFHLQPEYIPPGNDQHLLALLPGQRPHSFREYQRIARQQGVTLWCIHSADAGRLLRQGHLFYTLACTPARLVYDNERTPLPARENKDTAAVIQKARVTFTRCFALAAAFLDGAHYYTKAGQAGAAAFSLHQATEQALRAFLLSITGYNAYGHDLRGLLRRYTLFAPTVFCGNEEPLLHLLNNAYTHTRYKSRYTIGDGQLTLLLHNVSALHAQVQQCFAGRVAAFEASG